MFCSHSPIRTNTIFCSFSGMRSIANDSPERAGPICIHCDSSVPPSLGSSRKRQTAVGFAGSSTAQATARSGSHSTTCDVVDHSPNASCLLCPTNLAPTAGSVAPSSHSIDRSSLLMVGMSSMSDTSSHTRCGDASIHVCTSTVGLSAYRAPVHSIARYLRSVQFAALAQRIGQLHPRLAPQLRVCRTQVGTNGVPQYAQRPARRFVGVPIGDQIHPPPFGLGE